MLQALISHAKRTSEVDPASAQPFGGAGRIDVPSFATGATGRRARRDLLSEAADSALAHALIGLVVGDAFGLGIALQDAKWIREEVKDFDVYPQSPVLADASDEGADIMDDVRGFYSSDMGMVVGTVKALAHSGTDVDAGGLWRAWTEEHEFAMHRRPPPAEPGAERAHHADSDAKHVWRGERTLDEAREGQRSSEDPGHAPVVRALPLGFVSDAAARERLCAVNADATHPHPRARAASLVIAAACRYLVVEKRAASGVLRAALAALCASSLSDSATESHLRAVDKLPDYHAAYGARYQR